MNLKKNINLTSNDYIKKEIIIHSKKIKYFYNEVLTDSKKINELVLIPLTKLKKKELKRIDNYLPNCNIKIIKETDITNYLNNGFVILLYKKAYAIELKANLSRGVSKIDSELSLSGPKDSFQEDYNTNLGLIRKRIKSNYLKTKEFNIGKYTNTKIGILYIDGIVKKDIVNHIIKKLLDINIDGIIDSSYLKQAFEKNNNSFPTIMMSERPDKCSMALLEGKVLILVDMSPYVLILPSFFWDYFHTTDDYYQKAINTTFIRIIRLLAFFIALLTPAIYISVTTRNYNLIPINLLYILKAGRTFVPFPAYIEATFMIICFEILKESDLRMSQTSGSAISILGGLILGDAAVAAGIVSPIMIIIIAISSIAGLIFTSIELSNTIRNYKLLFLFLATIYGIYGVIIGIILLLYNINKTEIFGYSYFSINKDEISDSIIRINKKNKKRNKKLTNNIERGTI